MSAAILEPSTEPRRPSSVALADVGAVQRAVLIQAEVPLARRVLSVLVEPDFSFVIGLAVVDVEELARVGHGSDPGLISKESRQ